MPPFDTYDLIQAQSLITGLKSPALTANKKFVLDDHWQGGDGWNGPMPSTKFPAAYQRIIAEIERAFTSENVIGEFVERHTLGVVGREPKWSLTVSRPLKKKETPTQGEQKQIAEAEALATTWWDRQRIHQDLQEAVETLCWASTKTKANEAPLRLFVPMAFVQEWNAGKQVSFEEALQNIYLEAAPPESLTMIQDRATMREAGLYLYESTATKQPRAELVYVDDDGKTVVRVLQGGQSAGARVYPAATPADAAIYDLGGRLLHFVMRRRPLFGESVRRLQKSLNKSLTMMDENQNNAGWLQRIIINGRMADDAEIGPHVVQEIIAAFYDDIVDGQAVKKPLPVSVVHQLPVSPETYLDTQDGLRAAILRLVSQLHVLIQEGHTINKTVLKRRNLLEEWRATHRLIDGGLQGQHRPTRHVIDGNHLTTLAGTL